MTENVKKEALAFEKENELLNDSMLEIEATEDGKVLINGKYYTKVSKRLQILRQKLGFNFRIETSLLHLDQNTVVAKAVISIFRDGLWFDVSSGHAEEVRASSEINKYAAVENAETSAIGRALAGIGLSGDEYASLEEMLLAQNRKNNEESPSSEKKDSANDKTNKAPKKEVYISEPMVAFITKLLENTNTDKNLFLKHFNVKDVDLLTMKQGREAIDLLKRKEEKQRLLKQTLGNKDEQDNAITVLQENNQNSQKTFTSINLDDGTESASPVNKSNKVDDDILMDDDEDDVIETNEQETVKESDTSETETETETETEKVEAEDKVEVEEKTKNEVKEKKEEGSKKAGRKTNQKTGSGRKQNKTKKTGNKKEKEKDDKPVKRAKKDDLNEDDDITL